MSIVRIICIFVACFSVVYGTAANPTQEQLILSNHNAARKAAKSSMPNLAWSTTIENSANAWVSKCQWGHSGTPGMGENVYATSVRNNPNAFKSAIAAWVAEKPFYNYGTNTCASGKVCGHYTQVVWAKSTHVGCAYQDCPKIAGISWANGGTLVTCQYSPPGNYVGQKPY